jgi:hypothetical protein
MSGVCSASLVTVAGCSSVLAWFIWNLALTELGVFISQYTATLGVGDSKHRRRRRHYRLSFLALNFLAQSSRTALSVA